MTSRLTALAILAAGFSACGTSTALSAEIAASPPITGDLFNPYPERGLEQRNLAPTARDLGMGLHIRIEGDIVPGDVEKLTPLMEGVDRFNQTIISLNSTGGNLAAALKVADLVHSRRVATYVGPGDVCLSACAWIFLAGQNEWIRNVLFVPARFVHRKGRVGFHAPFNQEVPEGPVDALTAEHVAEVYYDIAREAIREITRRIAPWHISPRLVVELLGRGPTEFYDIDRFWKLTQNQIRLLVDHVTYPSAINPLQAAAGCDFVFHVNLAPSYEYGPVVVGNLAPLNVFRGVSWKDVRTDDFEAVTRRDAVGRPSFEFEGVVLGRGPFRCTVKKNQQDRWEVLTDGGYPMVIDRMGDDPRIDRHPYELSSYAALGPALPWTAMNMPDLLIEGQDDDKDGLSDELESVIPATYRRISGPGFDCASDLDPAAKVICRFPTLARMDGVMGAMYRDRAKDDQTARRTQQAWLSVRNNACRARDIADEAVMLMEGYCLLYLTVARINELKDLSPQ